MHRYVEKIRVPVRLARIGAPPEAGYLALSPDAESAGEAAGRTIVRSLLPRRRGHSPGTEPT